MRIESSSRLCERTMREISACICASDMLTLMRSTQDRDVTVAVHDEPIDGGRELASWRQFCVDWGVPVRRCFLVFPPELPPGQKRCAMRDPNEREIHVDGTALKPESNLMSSTDNNSSASNGSDAQSVNAGAKVRARLRIFLSAVPRAVLYFPRPARARVAGNYLQPCPMPLPSCCPFTKSSTI
jgi:hypothetical protein